MNLSKLLFKYLLKVNNNDIIKALVKISLKVQTSSLDSEIRRRRESRRLHAATEGLRQLATEATGLPHRERHEALRGSH